MKKIRPYLLKFCDDIPGVLVEEAFASIVQGKHEAIGLTKDEALDLLERWLLSFAKKNGMIALEKLEEAGDVTRRLIQNIKSVRGSLENLSREP